MRDVRFEILSVFAFVFAITILLSLYLAGTITRPVQRLAAAAEHIRRDRTRKTKIPAFEGRNDEIGDLARSLREMTEALWHRMDAIDRFAADVAHEIKNPLTSVRSAVETAAQVQNPEKQKKLMGIVLDDVQRLDRLISDISGPRGLMRNCRALVTKPLIWRQFLRSCLKFMAPQRTVTARGSKQR